MAAFVRNLWYAAGWATDIASDLIGIRILDEPVLLYRIPSGEAVAIGGTCPHRFAPLHLGRMCEDGSVECPYHGLRFDRTGACVLNPHENGRIPGAARVASYPLVERHGVLWIWMGDAAKADPAAIPLFDQVTDPAKRTVKGQTHLAANYEIVADNLLDLSHTQFLHANFLKADHILTAKHEVSQEGRTLFSRRWIPDIVAPPSFARQLANPTARVDHWIRARWDAPGLHRLDIGATLTGRPEDEGIRIEGSHLLTPETQVTTHYFYSHTRNVALDSESEDERVRNWHQVGFNQQDKPMIEAVQRRMGGVELLELHPILFSIDAAAMRARRILARLRGEEQPDIISQEAAE